MSTRIERLQATIRKIADSDAAERQAHGQVETPVGTSGNPSQQILTPANIITFCRLGLTIAFLVIFCTHGNRTVALVCYAVAAVTDFLDGQVARRTQTVSWLGKIMDPIMDRVLLFTGVLGLLVVGELPVWIPVFVIGRDLYLAIGATILQKFRARPVDVVFIGKVTTALLMSGGCCSAYRGSTALASPSRLGSPALTRSPRAPASSSYTSASSARSSPRRSTRSRALGSPASTRTTRRTKLEASS